MQGPRRQQGLDSRGCIYWDRAPSAAGGSIRYVGRYDYCSLTRINQELDAGYPVIVTSTSRGA